MRSRPRPGRGVVRCSRGRRCRGRRSTGRDTGCHSRRSSRRSAWRHRRTWRRRCTWRYLESGRGVRRWRLTTRIAVILSDEPGTAIALDAAHPHLAGTEAPIVDRAAHHFKLQVGIALKQTDLKIHRLTVVVEERRAPFDVEDLASRTALDRGEDTAGSTRE